MIFDNVRLTEHCTLVADRSGLQHQQGTRRRTDSSDMNRMPLSCSTPRPWQLEYAHRSCRPYPNLTRRLASSTRYGLCMNQSRFVQFDRH